MNTPDSIKEHQAKYHVNAWKQYSAAELGQWVALLIKRAGHRTDAVKQAKDLLDAQNYLNMLQAHIDAVTAMAPNELLTDLPMVETIKPTVEEAMRVASAKVPLKYESVPLEPVLDRVPGTLAEVSEANRTEDEKQVIKAIADDAALRPLPAPEPEGIVMGEDGKILAISAQPGERGYDPDAHEKELMIFCDGVHIESAHTADVDAGTLKFYEKNAQGRIKTISKSGKIEIRGNFS